MMKIYHTSFCNFGHVVENGYPVLHECYILDPAKLRRERDGDETVYKEDMKLRFGLRQEPKIVGPISEERALSIKGTKR